MSVVVIICGGRSLLWTRGHEQWLREQHAAHDFGEVLVGSNHRDRDGGPIGADAHAYDWAARQGIERLCKDANWTKYGRPAGPRRNSRMLVLQCLLADAYDRGRLVLGFPGGPGTADMCRQASAAGVEVLRYRGMPVRQEGVA